MYDLIQGPEVKIPHNLLTYDTAIFNSAFIFLKTRMYLLDGTNMHFRLIDSRTVEQRSFLEIYSKYNLNIVEKKNLGPKRFSGPD